MSINLDVNSDLVISYQSSHLTGLIVSNRSSKFFWTIEYREINESSTPPLLSQLTQDSHSKGQGTEGSRLIKLTQYLLKPWRAYLDIKFFTNLCLSPTKPAGYQIRISSANLEDHLKLKIENKPP